MNSRILPCLVASTVVLQQLPCVAQNLLVRQEIYATPMGTYGLAAGDFNGDGWLDIASTNFATEHNGGRGVTAYLNNHGAGFTGRADYLTGYRTFGITSGDFNRDNRDDLAFATYYGQALSVLYANADGTFSARVDHAIAAQPSDVVAGDFNRDGILDLAANHYSLSTLFGQPGGGFGSRQLINTNTAGYGNLVAADLNRDGDLDLAQTTGDGETIQIMLGQSNGSFGPSQEIAVGPSADALAVGDLDGDGLVDLVATNWRLNRITTLLAQEEGGFGELRTYNTKVTPQALAIGDLNGDGSGDLAVLEWNNGAGALSLYLGSADGELSLVQRIPTYGSGKDIIIADFNKDRRLDVAVAASTLNTNESSFSVFYQAIPEPSTLLLSLAGFSLLTIRRR